MGLGRRRRVKRGRSHPTNLFVAAWVVARAYSPGGKWRAPLAYLGCVLTLSGVTTRGGLYVTEGKDGAFLLAPRAPVADIAIGLAIVAASLAVPTALLVLLGVDAGTALGVSAIALAVILLAYAASRTRKLPRLGDLWSRLRRSPSLVTKNTPQGERYAVTSLAQAPGTTMTAVRLLREAIIDLPVGSVILADAGDDDLLQKYVKRGFTHDDDGDTRSRRVYMVR